MNGKKARMLRKEVYEKDFVSGAAGRRYTPSAPTIQIDPLTQEKKLSRGTIFADSKRSQYKKLKRLYVKEASIG